MDKNKEKHLKGRSVRKHDIKYDIGQAHMDVNFTALFKHFGFQKLL